MSYLDDLSVIWRVTRGDPRISIAVLDGPVDREHPSLLAANLTDLSHCPPPKKMGDAAAAHGTHVCSLIFGQGPGGIQGIAPQCRGIVISIFRDGKTPGSIVPCSQIELAAAIDRAVVAGANIINISGGQFSAYGTAHPILSRVIRQAARQGILIVSATGNDACPCHHIPSADPSVLAVGAHDTNNNALESSNWGARYRQNGVVALGENILGAVPGGTRYCSGTSFATPIVSGVAALLMSCLLKENRKPVGRDIQQAILQTAFRCFEPNEACQRLLAGRMNPLGAFNLLLKDTQTMTHPTNESTSAHVTASTNSPTNGANQSDNLAVNPVADQPALGAPTASHPVGAAVGAVPAQTATGVPNGSNQFNPQVTDMTPSGFPASGVAPSDCGCGCTTDGAMVYALGEIGFDYGTEARRDSVLQHLRNTVKQPIPKPPKEPQNFDPNSALDFPNYLSQNLWAAEGLIWTLSMNNVPVYAIRPSGPYAADAYKLLVDFYHEQLVPVKVEITDEAGTNKETFVLSERAAIPGRVVGSARLLNGETIPVIQPEIRGMANWNLEALVNQDPQANDRAKKSIVAVLNKFYTEYQNLGITPQDRSINYVATNIVQASKIITDSIGKDRFFDKVEVEPSEICRPHSECWVVILHFFKPETRDVTERKIYRITVDVSDIVPVTIGSTVDWHVR